MCCGSGRRANSFAFTAAHIRHLAVGVAAHRASPRLRHLQLRNVYPFPRGAARLAAPALRTVAVVLHSTGRAGPEPNPERALRPHLAAGPAPRRAGRVQSSTDAQPLALAHALPDRPRAHDEALRSQSTGTVPAKHDFHFLIQCVVCLSLSFQRPIRCASPSRSTFQFSG
jgi:hypothetical protein